MRRAAILGLCGTIAGAAAWEFPRIAFTPQDGGQHRFSLDDKDDIDIVTGSQFNGLKTFANLPYVNCFSDAEAKGKKYDIAVMGAPFDTVSSNPPAKSDGTEADRLRSPSRPGPEPGTAPAASGSEARG